MLLPVRRTRDHAVIAGVCAGFAQRWKVDPNLLRIALVVACLASGLGLVIYGVAILVVPAVGSTQAPVHRLLPFTRRWPMPGLIAALGVTGFLAFGLIGGWSGLGFLPFVLALVIWVAARRRAIRANGASADPTPFERAAEAWRQRLVEHQVNAGALPASALPAIASPPPVAPAPAETAAAAPARRPGGRLWWLAIALSAVGITIVALTGTPHAVASGLPYPAVVLPYLAVVLASLGITLLVATRRGRPRLMGFVTILLLIATLLTLAAPSARLDGLSTADGSVQRFTTAAEIPPSISASAGDLHLDFSRLELTSDIRVAVTLGAGAVTIDPPKGSKAEVTWTIGAGSVTTPGGSVDGGANLDDSYHHNISPDGPTLYVDVDLRLGNLEVTG